MSRVFEIRVGKAIGTSFFVPVNGKEYLFTANHVVEGVGEQGDIELLNNNQWQALNVRVIHADSRCNDVAVLILKPKAWTVNADPLVSTHSLFVGQEIYFLGFPYGLVVQANNYNWTFPLVKHGYTSAVAKCSDIETGAPSEKELILLDGFNNPGFSGGPVITRDFGDPTFRVLAIVKGYRYEKMPVSVNGRIVDGASVSTNTGIVVATPFDNAIDLIKSDAKKEDSSEEFMGKLRFR